MAKCLGCSNNDLIWVQVKGKPVLMDIEGNVHSCVEYRNLSRNKPRNSGCPHGILLDRWCDQCGEEERK